MKLNSIVASMIVKHNGGSAFFNAVDDIIKQDESIILELINKARELHSDMNVIVSGEFGLYFTNSIKSIDNVIAVNGSLRKDDAKVIDLDPFADQIRGKEFVFIDDSFYSGTTRNKINEALNEYDASIVHTVVAYDGSETKEDSVHSLFRYYDHYYAGNVYKYR